MLTEDGVRVGCLQMRTQPGRGSSGRMRTGREGGSEGEREGDTAQQSTHLFLQTQRVKAALVFYTRVNGRRPGIFSEPGGAPYSLQ